MVGQNYLLEAESQNVIVGNSAIFRCKIPSFVGDFVAVTEWIEDTSDIHYYATDVYGKKMLVVCV